MSSVTRVVVKIFYVFFFSDKYNNIIIDNVLNLKFGNTSIHSVIKTNGTKRIKMRICHVVRF